MIPLVGRTVISPASLFAASEPGVWFDASDLSTLWQDVAGTTPVTAAGQAVARWDDKSGRAQNATQATVAARPIYRVDPQGFSYLEFDGVDDALIWTAGANVAQPFQIIMGLDAYLAGTGTGDANLYRTTTGAVGYRASSGANWSIFAGAVLTAAPAYVAGEAVRTDVYDGASSAIRSNGIAFSGAAGATALASATQLVGIGARSDATQNARVNLYGFVARGAATPTPILAAVERWMGSRVGISF